MKHLTKEFFENFIPTSSQSEILLMQGKNWQGLSYMSFPAKLNEVKADIKSPDQSKNKFQSFKPHNDKPLYHLWSVYAKKRYERHIPSLYLVYGS